MRNINRSVIFTLILFFIASSGINGQSGMQNFISPEVNKDRTVTFRLRAPNAKDVKLSTQFIRGQQAMTKDANGIWTITLGPVEPEIYPYSFIVDGIQVADPKNSWISPEGFQNSVIKIPRHLGVQHTRLPHGTVSYRYYYSKNLGQDHW